MGHPQLLEGRYTALLSEPILGEVLDDEPGNRVLECAVTGRADIIVTGDRAMLSLGTFKDIEVVSLRAFPGRVQSDP